MKPDFFDDNNLDEICNPDKSENEIDIDFKPSIECKSRYILVFELYNEDELKRCKVFKNFNYIINNINFRLFDSEKATNKYHIFNGINAKKIDKIIHYIEIIKNKLNKTTKRIYILDIKKDLQLIYAAKIANINIKNELKELLYKLDDALLRDKEMAHPTNPVGRTHGC